MTILEASGKQEPEAKETPAGPLEEVRVHSAHPTPATSISLRRLLLKGVGEEGTVAPYPLCPSCCVPRGGRYLFFPTIL